MDESDLQFLAIMAYVYIQYGKAEQAVPLLKIVRRFRPHDGQTSRLLAFAYLRSGDYESCASLSRHLLAEAAAEGGSDDLERFLHCRALWGLGQREEAVLLHRNGELPDISSKIAAADPAADEIEPAYDNHHAELHTTST